MIFIAKTGARDLGVLSGLSQYLGTRLRHMQRDPVLSHRVSFERNVRKAPSPNP